MEAAPDISTIVLTYRRDDRLADTLAALARQVGADPRHELVLVDNNADGVDRSPLLEGFLRSRLVTPPRNLGVCGGRNEGIQASCGSTLVFLDDDALPETPGMHGIVDAAFDADPALGAIAFRSLLGTEGGQDPAEVPHTDKRRDPAVGYETFRFVGVGHALRREVLRSTRPYHEDFFYGSEEFDLSWRILKAGYRIRYEPAIVVRHMRDPGGRLPSRERVEHDALNRMRIGFMHLPLRLAILQAAAWAAYALVLTRGRARLHRVAAEFVRWAVRNRGLRRPASPEILARVRGMGGVAWR